MNKTNVEKKCNRKRKQNNNTKKEFKNILERKSNNYKKNK